MIYCSLNMIYYVIMFIYIAISLNCVEEKDTSLHILGRNFPITFDSHT